MGKSECSYCKKLGHTDKSCFKKKYFDEFMREIGKEKESDGTILLAVCEINEELEKEIEIQDTFLMAKGNEWVDEQEKERSLCTCDDIQEWLDDSGASHQVTNTLSCLIHLHEADDDEKVTIGDRKEVQVISIGDVCGDVITESWKNQRITITDVAYIPMFCAKLFILRKAIDCGISIANSRQVIQV